MIPFKISRSEMTSFVELLGNAVLKVKSNFVELSRDAYWRFETVAAPIGEKFMHRMDFQASRKRPALKNLGI